MQRLVSLGRPAGGTQVAVLVQAGGVETGARLIPC